MRLMMHHLRHFGRDDYFGRSSYVYRSKPVLSHKEFLAEQSSEAANQEIIDEEVFHGFRIAKNLQALETGRLGVRDAIADTIEDKYTEKDGRGNPKSETGEQIIDLSINERLKSILRENKKEEEKQAPVFSVKKWTIKGMRNIRDMRGLFNADRDFASSLVEKRFGPGESTREKMKYVVDRLKGELKDNFSKFLTQLSVSEDELADGKTQILPSKVIEAYNAASDDKIPKALLFPPMSRKRGTAAIHDFLDLLRIEAQERNKRLSTTLYDPNRLQTSLDLLSSFDINTLFEQLGKNALPFYHQLMFLREPDWKPVISVDAKDFADVVKKSSKENLQQAFDKVKNHVGDLDPNIRNLIDNFNVGGAEVMPLLKEILGEDILYDLVEDHESQALLAHVEYVTHKKGASSVVQMLEKIKENLPAAKEEVQETHNSSEEAEKLGPIQKILDELGTIQATLADNYIKAMSVGSDLAAAEADMAKVLEKAKTGSDKDSKAKSLEAAFLAEVQKKRGKKAEVKGDILAAERSMKLKLKNLFGQLEKFALDKDSTPKLLALRGILSSKSDSSEVDKLDLKPSEDEQIFGYQEGNDWKGPKDNPFKNSILGFDSSDFDTMKKEAADNIQSKMKPRTKLTARQLLFKLKEMDMEEKGVTNPGQRQRFALLSTNLMVADAQNKQLYRSTNMELAERLGDTFLGSRALARAGKWFRKNFWASSIYEAQDVVDHVTGFDKELKMFRGMSPDITLAELRDLIERNGGISTAKLFEMISKLKEVFQSFELINSAGKVELYDNDAVTMEELIMKLQVLYEEYRTRQFFESVKDKDGSKAELILDLIKENRATVEEEEKGILEQVANKFADWKQWFSKNVLKREFHDKYVAAEEHLKKNRIRGAERQAYLEDQGLAGFVGVLGTGYAVAEAAGVAQKGLGWTWDKLRRGSGWSYGMGTGLLAGAWRNILRPIGKYGIVKPAEYLIWKPTKWTAKTAGKIVAFPFVAAGNIVKGGYRWVRS